MVRIKTWISEHRMWLLWVVGVVGLVVYPFLPRVHNRQMSSHEYWMRRQWREGEIE